MIQKRIYVNLAVFLGLFALLAYWAVRNVVRFDFIERPYKISAEFETSPGLRSGFDVTYLGVRVGNIGKTELISDGKACATNADLPEEDQVPACVHVELKIDRGVKLPAELNAAVRRKSAVGEPAVDLSAIAGTDRESQVEKGTNIPIFDKKGPDGSERKRTTTPLSYSDLFEALDGLVSSIPAEDLNTLVHELALGVDDQAPEFRTIVQSATDLTTTLAGNSALIDQLLGDITHLTSTLLDKTGPFVSSLDSLELFTGELARSRSDLAALLDRTPVFLQALSQLLEQSGGDIGCLVDSLGTVTLPALAGDKPLSEVSQLLNLAAPTIALLNDVSIDVPDGLAGPYTKNYLNAGFLLRVGAPVEMYNPPKTLPPPPANKVCTAAGPSPGPGGTPSDAKAGGSASPSADDHGVLVPDRAEPPPPTFDPATKKDADKKTIIDQLKDALPLLLILGLIIAVVLFLLNEYAKRQDQADRAKKAKSHSVSRAAFALVKQGEDPTYLADIDPDVIQAAELAGEPVPPPPVPPQE